MKLAWTLIVAALIFAACAPSVQPGAKGGESPPASPSPSVSPTPVRAPLTASDTTAVVFFHDAANVEQVDGMTWDGAVGQAPAIPDYHAANPSETLFGTPTDIRNRKGAVVHSGNYGLKSFTATWADDDVHFCLIEPFDFLGANGVPATLRVGSAEGGISTIVQVGKIYEQATAYVASCSLAGDRAVVVQSGGQGVGAAQYWVVQLSTGKILWTHDFSSRGVPTAVVASHDSRYIAENQDIPSGAQTSTIYAADGSEVMQLNASVAAFSWDGSMAVVFSHQAPAPAWAITMNDRRVLWSAPVVPRTYVWSAKAEPNGTHLAVALANPANQGPFYSGYPPVDLYLLAADGSAVTVLKGIYW